VSLQRSKVVYSLSSTNMITDKSGNPHNPNILGFLVSGWSMPTKTHLMISNNSKLR